MIARRNGHKARDPLAGLDDGAAVAKLMRPFHEALIGQAYAGAAAAGIDVAFDLENEFVQGVLDQLAQRVTAIAETTKADVQALIGKQAAEGWSLERLQEEIRKSGAIVGRSRALLIARTETALATSLGSQAAWKQSGVVDRKEWLASADSCDLCQALDGQVVGLDEDFTDGVAEPPYHPACTCALSPVLAA